MLPRGARQHEPDTAAGHDRGAAVRVFCTCGVQNTCSIRTAAAVVEAPACPGGGRRGRGEFTSRPCGAESLPGADGKNPDAAVVEGRPAEMEGGAGGNRSLTTLFGAAVRVGLLRRPPGDGR